jgi:hypothetical protein
MARKNEITNQNQDQQIIIEAQVPESQNSENQPLDAAVRENGSEASAKVVPSSLPSREEVGELDEHVKNDQTAHRQGNRPERQEPPGRLHEVTPGPSPDVKQSSVVESAKVERVRKSSSRRATGPKTREGKRRSRFNARKHGICSKEILLKNESPAEFELLRKGLWEDYSPLGTMETETLNDLIVVRWNKHRVNRAINAIFAAKVNFSEFDRMTTQQAVAWDSEQWGGAQGGMLKPGCNHFVLGKGIEFLKQIRSSVEARGFRVEVDRDLLNKLYGTDTDGKAQSGVFHFYLLAASCASAAREGKQKVDPDELKKQMIEVLDEEIRNLTALKTVVLDVELERMKYGVDEALLSRQAALDLYIRYDTYLSRETDRLLNRLERLQRMRKGLPLPPQVDLKIS